MNLKERSIDAHNKRKERTKEESLQEAENFYEYALKAIKERFGDNYTHVQILEKNPGMAVFDVDDIKMKITKSQGYPDIYIIQKCPTCGGEYEERIVYLSDPNKVLEDIGKILHEKHDDYECERILKEKQGHKEPTTEEKLLVTLRQFILENGGEFVG